LSIINFISQNFALKSLDLHPQTWLDPDSANARENPDPDSVDPKHGTECGFETYYGFFWHSVVLGRMEHTQS
jgi:hypothetical protein